jgi:HK97 family phage major capsid protein
MISQTQPVAQRRSLLARTVVSLVNKNGPLTAEERKRFTEIREEMDALEPQIRTEADRKYEAAFRSYLRYGLDSSSHQRGLGSEERAVFLDAQRIKRELRMDTAGGEAAYPGSSGGYFAPMLFEQTVASAERYYGCMLDVSNRVETTSGAPMGFPADDDATITGEIVPENAQSVCEDVPLSLTMLSSFKFSSRIVKMSMELAQDAGFPIDAYLADRFGIRLGRAMNTKFTRGAGSVEPTGLITAAPIGAAAVGSYSTDGVGGANTVGVEDLLSLEMSVDPAYRGSASYMMHANTLSFLKGLKDRSGRPIYSLGEQNFVNGYSCLVNNDMDQLPAAPSSPAVTAKTVAFGKFSKYTYRSAPLMVFRLAQRGFEYGQVWYLAFQRADGNLIDGGGGAVKVLTNTF